MSAPGPVGRSREGLRRRRGARHSLALAAHELDGFGVSSDPGGVVLGADEHGAPVRIQLFRSAPTRLVLLGGLYLAHQVALRAAATGSIVVVATGRPAAWTPMVHAAAVNGGDQQVAPVQVRDLGPAPLPRPAQDRPLLMFHDGGAAPQELYPPRNAWQATAVVLPYLHSQIGTTATSADLVLLRRLPVGQAQLAARLWALTSAMVQVATTLADDGVLALGPDLELPVRLVTTPLESALLGPVRWGD